MTTLVLGLFEGQNAILHDLLERWVQISKQP
jgi:hypothetical protein